MTDDVEVPLLVLVLVLVMVEVGKRVETGTEGRGDWSDQHTPCLLRPSNVIDSAWHGHRTEKRGRL